MRVDRISVSTLGLGLGSSRRSFLERITRILIFGSELTQEILGIATPRQAAPVTPTTQCHSSPQATLWIFPFTPHPNTPLRVLLASSIALDPLEIALYAPDGTVHRPPLKRLGGPPFGYLVEIPSPALGRWTIVAGDGPRIVACRRCFVGDRLRTKNSPEISDLNGWSDPRFGPLSSSPPVWPLRRAWNRHTLALYSLFVEALFDYPIDSHPWPNLSALLRVREKNILYNALGQEEDTSLELRPDCADLPYFLRAYFAWKLGLPFGARECDRGGRNRPPSCLPLEVTNLMPRILVGNARERKNILAGSTMDGGLPNAPGTASPLRPGLLPNTYPGSKSQQPRRSSRIVQEEEVRLVQSFIARDIGGLVQSASGRTAPSDNETDTYPIPLSRTWLHPGTLFVDPFGHVIVVTRWAPQDLNRPGFLVGADAQPDGTIGLRRFWQGTFLFRPDTTEGGAGFKHFRPLRLVRDRDPNRGLLQCIPNEDLTQGGHFAPFSDEQNRKPPSSFYDRIESLANPRPVSAKVRLEFLIDALEESIKRRVISVENAERFFASHPGSVIPMPSGHAIFETTGPWEDYATPSRDMRLLIALDTVLAFPEEIRRRPQRFGFSTREASNQAAYFERRLHEELAKRHFEYRRSDRSTMRLSLADLVQRMEELERAYNPNDCVEVRWGAKEGSREYTPCSRRAPDEQRARMETYRRWFRTRTRPPR